MYIYLYMSNMKVYLKLGILVLLYCWNKIPDTHKLKQERFIWAQFIEASTHCLLVPRQGTMAQEHCRGIAAHGIVYG